MSDIILVGGATGRTGSAALETLLKLGKPVRALVHSDDERAHALRERGAEVAIGDYSDVDSVRAALKGVGAAYFAYPIKPGLVEATTVFAQAAREAGVGAIVNMSQVSAARHSKSHAAQNHWLGERVLDWAARPVQEGDPSEGGAPGSTMGVTHLRPTFFADWLVSPLWRADILERKVIPFPFGDVKHAPIASEDQGRLIGHILADPAPHAGKTYKLYGPKEVHYSEVAEDLSDALGTKITYAPLTIDEFQQKLETVAKGPSFFGQHLVEVARNYADGMFSGTNDIIERVTGEPPMPMTDYIERHRDAFA